MRTALKLSVRGVYSPAAPERLRVLMHRFGAGTDVVYSSKDLTALRQGDYGRIEVQLPIWLGQCDGELPRVGNEPHPVSHMDVIVKVAAMMRPYLAEKGTLWLSPVESCLNLGVYGLPPAEVLAKRRHANRPRTQYNRNLSPNFDLLGVLGEIAFARQFGGRIDLDQRTGERSDPGFDFATRAGTVNVKCTLRTSEHLLLQQSRKHTAQIQVLAFANDDLSDATLVGWEYTTDILGQETFDPGYGEPAWSRHFTKLRPIESLRLAAEIPWLPSEPVGIVNGVLDRMLKDRWQVWGTGFTDPRPVEIGVPRIYVFSPRSQ